MPPARSVDLTAPLNSLTHTNTAQHRKMTLLEFFVGMIADRGEGELLLFTSEVYDLERAARLSDASVIAGDFKNIKLELAGVVSC